MAYSRPVATDFARTTLPNEPLPRYLVSVYRSILRLLLNPPCSSKRNGHRIKCLLSRLRHAYRLPYIKHFADCLIFVPLP
jgi:hypothetical protein